jgi:hypothetical protein
MDTNNLKTKTKDFVKKHKDTIGTVGCIAVSLLCYRTLAIIAVERNEVKHADLYTADDGRMNLVLTKRNGKIKDFGWSKTKEI